MMTVQDVWFLKLMEECSEVAQRASKLLQFGPEQSQANDPHAPAEAQDNRARLQAEISDVTAIISLLGYRYATTEEILAKKLRVEKYIAYSQQLGTVTKDDELEIAEANLAELAKHFFKIHDIYSNAWLREMGGVIVPKHHAIDGFVLRARSIYEKAQLVDRIKAILSAELEKNATANEMFDAVFKMLAENRRDSVPTN